MNESVRKAGAGVRVKLISVMLLICIVPLVIAVVVSSVTSFNKSLSDATYINDQKAKVVEQSYMDVINQMNEALTVAANDPYVLNYITNPGSRNEADMVKWLQSIDDTLQGESVVVITGANGDQIVRSSGKLTNTADREYYQKAWAGEANISDVLVSKANGSATVIPIVPVKDASGKVVGTIQRSYYLSFLHDFLTTVVNKNNKEQAFILSRDGTLIGHSDYEIDVENLENYTQTPVVSNATADEGNFSLDYNGQKCMFSYQKEASTGWTVYTVSD